MSDPKDQKPSPPIPLVKPPPDSAAAREARLSAALRSNLRRRKTGPKAAD
jgi:hypothetical protein